MNPLPYEKLSRLPAKQMVHELINFCMMNPQCKVYTLDFETTNDRLVIVDGDTRYLFEPMPGTDHRVMFTAPDQEPREIHAGELRQFLFNPWPRPVATNDYAFQPLSFRYIRDITAEGSYFTFSNHWFAKVILTGIVADHEHSLVFVIIPVYKKWRLKVLRADGGCVYVHRFQSVGDAINASSAFLNSTFRDLVNVQLARGEINYASLCTASFQAS